MAAYSRWCAFDVPGRDEIQFSRENFVRIPLWNEKSQLVSRQPGIDRLIPARYLFCKRCQLPANRPLDSSSQSTKIERRGLATVGDRPSAAFNARAFVEKKISWKEVARASLKSLQSCIVRQTGYLAVSAVMPQDSGKLLHGNMK
ncbi:hypothetical protein AK812_SmicGene38189 [Symbiodinium microadriaticum]|uniref:Uncharacterized protein n=1 Tax=Symbiodinium microadriaticum TaxID=2951 RepID=A0A1Q9CEC2_SYMMI|nr:hypothetical protein AK812_SmicGene38189 [Symbiodinium microadriaticum]